MNTNATLENSPTGAGAGGAGDAPLVEAQNLRVWLPTGRRDGIQAVRNVSLRVAAGERVGIVGESGSGKSVTGRALSGLLPTNPRVRVEGSIRFRDGEEMVGASAKDWNDVRSRRVGMIFQDPLTFLNPVMRIGRQVAESIDPRRVDLPVRDEVLRVLETVGLTDVETLVDRYPHELSGGMRQRVLIAIAIAKRPDLLIADEPTTALDATVQRRVLATLDDAVSRLGTSLVLISHDLAVVGSMTDRISVMYSGRIVESGTTNEVLTAPKHPYTQALLRSVRSLTDPDTELWSIPPSLRREIDEHVALEAKEDEYEA
ncbi:ABC transporter ATP-binding protein [Pseudoclavibacter endophyticus]|uniref:ABC transporter ATP-binding protein n=1 Tax=Pseudoclavibacter endophyticus TaxID=1778590 RepID=A0A6H9WFH9_9MICO|nr:ABC transporter ATP-binding protein [Pseudoclavibacter endophyticus]KAB1649652.1 ABC transporter ATP-binding protein [Pseudoclavibacter endophyticus]GGA60901.1 ABC transporter ATP-binding protein [Pseudoclavibacter endophyticus]